MKKFKVVFIAKAKDKKELIKKLTKNKELKIDSETCAIEEVAPKKVAVAITSAEKQISKSEEYLNNLEDFYQKTELLCSEYEIKNPYSESIKKFLQKKPLNSKDKDELEKFKKVAKHTSIISLIKAYLVPLPEDDEEFSKLRLAQDLVKINLDLPKILRSPDYFEQTVLQSFENYRQLYVKKYLKMLENRCVYLKNFWKKEKLIKKKILALKTFDKIDALGRPRGAFFEKEIIRIKEDCPHEELDKKIIREVLQYSPTWNGINFIQKPVENLCDEFLIQLDSALEAKIALIKTKSVLETLKNSKKNSVQKLAKVLSFTNLNKIVDLFNPQTASAIGDELVKFFKK